MSGAVQPASSIRCLISGTLAAASGRFTVTRTISDPAPARSMHCCAVARASDVSVIVIDCTTTGAPPPTWTLPTFTPTVLWSFTSDMEDPMIASAVFVRGVRLFVRGVRLQPDPTWCPASAGPDEVSGLAGPVTHGPPEGGRYYGYSRRTLVETKYARNPSSRVRRARPAGA